MSFQAFPLLFLNLGGEMIYIINQRLKAQNIASDKAKKVINDIVGTMLSKHFVEELFKPQKLYSKKALRTVFEKLAHASIMRLNTASMDKLYDLMTMAVKYQVYMCPQPKDLLLITLNHLDNIRNFVSYIPVQQQVTDVYMYLMQIYGTLACGSFQVIRHTLMSFFQDYHVRVSLFLREQLQLHNGRFVSPKEFILYPNVELPGTVRIFNENGSLKEEKSFETADKYCIVNKTGSLDFIGDRVITLGNNMYATKTEDELVKTENVIESKQSHSSPQKSSETQSSYAKDELNLLANLLCHSDNIQKHEFRLNLYNTDDEEGFALRQQKEHAKKMDITIDASKAVTSEALSKIMGEMNIDEKTENKATCDLLDLMDLATS